MFCCEYCGDEIIIDEREDDFCSDYCQEEYYKENPPFGNGQG